MAREEQTAARYVFDTSALICYLADEPEASQVSRLKPQAAVPFMALTELYYLEWVKRGKTEADTLYGVVKSWGLPTLFPHERVILIAGRFKAVYKLGIADSYIAAFAADLQVPLVTKDLDYQPLAREMDLHLL